MNKLLCHRFIVLISLLSHVTLSNISDINSFAKRQNDDLLSSLFLEQFQSCLTDKFRETMSLFIMIPL